MGIQVRQEFPHCERCGIMVHERQRRILAGGHEGPVTFCSELCRDEQAELVGLADRGRWVDGDRAARAVRR